MINAAALDSIQSVNFHFYFTNQFPVKCVGVWVSVYEFYIQVKLVYKLRCP